MYMQQNLRPLYLLLMIVVVFGCTPKPYATTNKAHKKQIRSLTKKISQTPPLQSMDNSGYWVGTTNFGLRKPNYVIIHHTAQNTCDQTLKTFTLTRTQVSAHYVICRDGTVHQMLNDYMRAHHAGISKWGNETDLNSSSIGIELDNNGFEKFDERQVNSLLVLLDTLKNRYNIPVANFIGHGDIAPKRKNDPSVFFPWKTLADKGFGNWYTDTAKVTIPQTFDKWNALRIIGYDIKDSVSAMQSFKRHWLTDSTHNAGIDSAQMKVLYNVMMKFR